MKLQLWGFCLLTGLVLLSAGCFGKGNGGILQRYEAPVVEADWIRNGEAIVYNQQKWFPNDDIESLQDSEVFWIGEYRGVKIFVDKLDVQPYARLYTKFAVNQFRYYTLEAND